MSVVFLSILAISGPRILAQHEHGIGQGPQMSKGDELLGGLSFLQVKY